MNWFWRLFGSYDDAAKARTDFTRDLPKGGGPDARKAADPKEAWSRIEAWDFGRVREKLAETKGEEWCRDHPLDDLERNYRQFLFLVATAGGQPVVPWTDELDQFWHAHILDTRDYHAMCQEVFGYYVHHDPVLPKGTELHSKAWIDTQSRYNKAFGRRTGTKPGSSCGSACSTPIVLFAPCAALWIPPDVPAYVPPPPDPTPAWDTAAATVNQAASEPAPDPTPAPSTPSCSTPSSGSGSSCSSCSSSSGSSSSCGSSCGSGCSS